MSVDSWLDHHKNRLTAGSHRHSPYIRVNLDVVSKVELGNYVRQKCKCVRHKCKLQLSIAGISEFGR